MLQGRREDDRGQERLERTSEVAEKTANQGRFIWGEKEEKNCSKFLSYVERHEKGISGGLAGAVGVGSRLELLDSSSRANVLNLVTKGSFVHGTTTRFLPSF